MVWMCATVKLMSTLQPIQTANHYTAQTAKNMWVLRDRISYTLSGKKCWIDNPYDSGTWSTRWQIHVLHIIVDVWPSLDICRKCLRLPGGLKTTRDPRKNTNTWTVNFLVSTGLTGLFNVMIVLLTTEHWIFDSRKEIFSWNANLNFTNDNSLNVAI